MCADPNCPHSQKLMPPVSDPRCLCDKPIWIYIPAGEHIHCPVHPDAVIHGSPVRW